MLPSGIVTLYFLSETDGPPSTDLADGLLEGVELGVEGLCPGAVDDPALDVRPEVHLDDVVGALQGCNSIDIFVVPESVP